MHDGDGISRSGSVGLVNHPKPRQGGEFNRFHSGRRGRFVAGSTLSSIFSAYVTCMYLFSMRLCK
jgi:hypothetical protein